MPDFLSPDARSRLMARIRSRNTSPEMTVRRLIYAAGYRYRLHDAKLPGTPDIVFRKRKKVIFVHGCFWHGHSCKKGRNINRLTPQWALKIVGNIARDKRDLDNISKMGWSFLVVWECELRKSCIMETMSEVLDFIEE